MVFGVTRGEVPSVGAFGYRAPHCDWCQLYVTSALQIVSGRGDQEKWDGSIKLVSCWQICSICLITGIQLPFGGEICPYPPDSNNSLRMRLSVFECRTRIIDLGVTPTPWRVPAISRGVFFPGHLSWSQDPYTFPTQSYYLCLYTHR